MFHCRGPSGYNRRNNRCRVTIICQTNHHGNGRTVKPVLRDHINQDMSLAFQTCGCLLLHEMQELSALLSFSNK